MNPRKLQSIQRQLNPIKRIQRLGYSANLELCWEGFCAFTAAHALCLNSTCSTLIAFSFFCSFCISWLCGYYGEWLPQESTERVFRTWVKPAGKDGDGTGWVTAGSAAFLCVGRVRKSWSWCSPVLMRDKCTSPVPALQLSRASCFMAQDGETSSHSTGSLGCCCWDLCLWHKEVLVPQLQIWCRIRRSGWICGSQIFFVIQDIQTAQPSPGSVQVLPAWS